MRSAFMEYLVSAGLVGREQVERVARRNPEGEYVGQLAMLHGLLGGPEIEQILRAQQQERQLFGQLAVQMGLMDRHQLEVLLTGQAIRGCIEMLEDLALLKQIDMDDGLKAISSFISDNGSPDRVSGSV